LRNRKDDFKWVLGAVYAAAHPEFKVSFLIEFVQCCSKGKLPLFVGGDFNIHCKRSEKNNDKFEER
jgi:hypothetical protein